MENLVRSSSRPDTAFADRTPIAVPTAGPNSCGGTHQIGGRHFDKGWPANGISSRGVSFGNGMIDQFLPVVSATARLSGT